MAICVPFIFLVIAKIVRKSKYIISKIINWVQSWICVEIQALDLHIFEIISKINDLDLQIFEMLPKIIDLDIQIIDLEFQICHCVEAKNGHNSGL